MIHYYIFLQRSNFIRKGTDYCSNPLHKKISLRTILMLSSYLLNLVGGFFPKVIPPSFLHMFLSYKLHVQFTVTVILHGLYISPVQHQVTSTLTTYLIHLRFTYFSVHFVFRTYIFFPQGKLSCFRHIQCNWHNYYFIYLDLQHVQSSCTKLNVLI